MSLNQTKHRSCRSLSLSLLLGWALWGISAGISDSQPQPPSTSLWSDLNPAARSFGKSVILIHYTSYDAGYCVEFVQPAWVGYRLRRNNLGGMAERASGFMRESRLGGRDAEDRDFAGSGFDKGHLAPAADMAWSIRSMSESFSYANVSPQRPAFNRGIWKRLENQVRDWAALLPREDTTGLLVWSGPLLGDLDLRLGRLRIPEAFYKVIYHPQEARVAALLLPHAGSRASLQGYLVSVDSVEKLTGLDFLSGLPDQEEERLEGEVCEPCWAWSSQVNSPSRKSASGRSAGTSSVICSGTTKAGKPCRNITKDPSGLCHHHR